MYPEFGSWATAVSDAEQLRQKFDPSRFSAKHLGHCIVLFPPILVFQSEPDWMLFNLQRTCVLRANQNLASQINL